MFGSDDPLDILEALIESNRQRAKTNEQVGRAAQALLDVASQRAKRRQAQQALANQPQADESQKVATLPPSEKGKARDKVGEQLGISGHKAERAAAVVRTIDTLEREGKQREAAQLRTALNGKSVQRAYTEAQKKGFIAPSARVSHTPRPAG